MKHLILVFTALMIAGCGAVPKEPPKKVIRKVVVRGDTYCRLGEIDKWSVEDSSDSIQHARRVNAKYSRVCKGKS